MTLLQELLLYGCIALASFFIMEWLFYFFSDDAQHGEQRVKRRLGQIRDGVVQVGTNMRRVTQDGNADDLFIDKYYIRLLLNADSGTTLTRLYMVIAAITTCIILFLTLFAPIVPFFVSFIIALGIGFGLPTLILKRQIKIRYDKFAEQFPDAIELIVRSLRVGQPLNIAMQTVGKELPDPIGKEFELVSQEISYGKDVPDALGSMLSRINLQDLRFFVVAVEIQHESGGNLAEILENLSKVIRGRYRLMRKVKALTAEGRFSAWFLSVFPVLMVFVMNAINPGYYKKVSDFAYFNHLIVLVIIMLIVNVVAMRIITKVKV